MSSLIPFESAKLPAYLAGFNVAEFNSDLTAHASASYPVISIKGKVFAIVRDGERIILPNPKDPDSAATSIDVVLVKASKDKSKVFYINRYDPKQEAGKKPDCYSPKGDVPAADSEHTQATSCAVCKWNAWGSATNDKGEATKGKACQDSVRLAVVPAGVLNDPMLIRVPPASIAALGEYGQMLAKRGVPYTAVVTKISFDQEAESPKLLFKAAGFLGAEDFDEVKETLASKTTEAIIGAGSLFDGAMAPEVPHAAPAPEAEAPAAAPKVTRAPRAKPEAAEAPAPVKPAPKAAVVVDSDPDLDIDGIEFDD